MKPWRCAFVVVALCSAGCPEATAPGPGDSGAAKTTTSTASAIAKVTASATAATSAAPLPSQMAPAEKDVVAVTTKDAGVAGVGFELRGIAGQGWTVTTTPSEGDLFRVSGPPGGPLGLKIRAYDEKSADNVKLFESVETHKPMKAGKPEKVEIAGEPREAQSFRTGEGFATTAHCLIRLPAKPGAKTGLVFLAHSGLSDKTEPSCAKALDAPALKPIVASFRLVP
jgi:hypothetical protein